MTDDNKITVITFGWMITVFIGFGWFIALTDVDEQIESAVFMTVFLSVFAVPGLAWLILQRGQP